MKNKVKKPKKDQFRFEYAIPETKELVFEDDKGDKVKYKLAKNKPSNKTKK